MLHTVPHAATCIVNPVTPAQLAAILFLQVAVILATCRAIAALVRPLGQPPVIGEMIAGILLGPSLLGLVWPRVAGPLGWSFDLFPAESMPTLHALAQVGLALYMFLVGVEFDTGMLRRGVRTAAVVSGVGMVVPFALGGVLAVTLLGGDGMFTPEATATQRFLFAGTAMSITAFPMLARIVQDEGLSGTHIGTLVLGAGCLGDAAAWCVLAVVLAGFGGGVGPAVLAITGGGAYTLVVLLMVRPALRPLERRVENAGRLDHATLLGILTLVMLAAWTTDRIGVHAVFGAFILGAAVPRGLLSRELQRTMLPVVSALLVPLFFVYSGLNTRLDLLSSPGLWGLAVVVLLVACLGKGAACWAAARACGEPQRDALAIGALMNTRGMMELIVLNIGLERGIISPALFSIMIVMAVTTTLMGTPLFRLAHRARRAHPIPARPDDQIQRPIR